MFSWNRNGLIVQTWTHDIEGTHGIDTDSCYRYGLMLQTWTNGIDKDSWYRHGLMVLT